VSMKQLRTTAEVKLATKLFHGSCVAESAALAPAPENSFKKHIRVKTIFEKKDAVKFCDIHKILSILNNRFGA
jgi:hypothetical protein